MTKSRVEGDAGMAKPILVATSRYTRDVEDRIERDYNARRNLDRPPFSQEKLLNAAEGADALFITPADQLILTFPSECRLAKESSSPTCHMNVMWESSEACDQESVCSKRRRAYF
jgi:hypothetical protein